MGFFYPVPADDTSLGEPRWYIRMRGAEKDFDAMLKSVLMGKGAMPPRGGNPKLTDAQAQAALDFCVYLTMTITSFASGALDVTWTPTVLGDITSTSSDGAVL